MKEKQIQSSTIYFKKRSPLVTDSELELCFLCTGLGSKNRHVCGSYLLPPTQGCHAETCFALSRFDLSSFETYFGEKFLRSQNTDKTMKTGK